MKHNVIRYVLVNLFIGIVALATARAQVDTEQTRQVTIIQEMAPVGLAYWQSLRVNVLNPLAPPPPDADGRKYKMLLAVTIFNADGRVIARSDEVTLDPEEFHSFNFDRDDLPLAGEAGTGRLQVRAEIRYQFFSIVDRTQITLDEFPASLELIDNSSGKTEALLPAVQKVHATAARTK